MGGSSTGPNDYSASNLLAQITQQQWANYQAVYQPVEDRQIAYATDRNVPMNAGLQAGVISQNASMAARQGLHKGLQTSGVTLTPMQQMALDRKAGLSAGLAQVNAMNHASQGAFDTQTGILTGTPGSTTIGSNISQTV